MVSNLAMLTAGSSSLISMLMWGVAFVAIMYFMIVRPQKKRQQSMNDLLSQLSVGNRIQTIGGFIGEIVAIEGDDLIILSEETKLRVKKNAVAINLEETPETQAPAKEVKGEKIDTDIEGLEDFEI